MKTPASLNVPPTINIFAKRPPLVEDLQAMLAEIREKVKASQEEYLEKDVRRILDEDYFVERYLFRFDYQPAEALSMIEAYLRWRKALPKQIDELFPIEFYQYSAMFIYKPDRAGHLTIYIRVRLNRRIERFQEAQRQWILNCLFKAETEALAKKTGLAMVFDCTDMGMANIDMPMCYFLLEALIKYMPGLLRYALIYNLPRLYYYLTVATRAFLPTRFHNLLQFAKEDEIFNFIDRENLPPYLGGHCEMNHYKVPVGANSYKNWDQFQDLSLKEKDHIYKVFEPLLNEMIDEANKYFPENKQ